jgi:hypothetical protein
MNIEREWAREAPVDFSGEGRYTLDNLVSDFVRRRTDPASPLHKNRDDIVDACAEAHSLDGALWTACRSRRPNGKVHNHQSRVSAHARHRYYRRLTTARRRLKACGTFEGVLHICEEVGEPIPGIGPVTIYDVATRVAAFLKLEPRFVHMHAGALAGFRALIRSGTTTFWTTPGAVRVRDQVDPELLPGPLRRISPDEVEDFLCVYREVLHRVKSPERRRP